MDLGGGPEQRVAEPQARQTLTGRAIPRPFLARIIGSGPSAAPALLFVRYSPTFGEGLFCEVRLLDPG